MSNLAETLRTRLSPEHLAPLQTASEVAARQNAGLYLVGGTVRDLLLGYASTALDLSVVGDTEAVAGSLAAALEGEIVARSQFNTFKLSAGEIRLDLAMARREVADYPRTTRIESARMSTVRSSWSSVMTAGGASR